MTIIIITENNLFIFFVIIDNKVYLLDPGAYKDWGDGIGRRIMSTKDFAKISGHQRRKIDSRVL